MEGRRRRARHPNHGVYQVTDALRWCSGAVRAMEGRRTALAASGRCEYPPDPVFRSTAYPCRLATAVDGAAAQAGRGGSGGNGTVDVSAPSPTAAVVALGGFELANSLSGRGRTRRRSQRQEGWPRVVAQTPPEEDSLRPRLGLLRQRVPAALVPDARSPARVNGAP